MFINIYHIIFKFSFNTFLKDWPWGPLKRTSTASAANT